MQAQYGMTYGPAEIGDCDGCGTQNGRLFTGCMSCPIRNCARQKGVETCAGCSEYACEKLETFFKTEPDARAHLDALWNEN